jgi:hypothetical protein
MASLSDQMETRLSRGVATGLELQRELQVSQPTFSRAVRACGQRLVRIGAGRSARYGLRREIPTIGSSWPAFVMDDGGSIRPCGELVALARDQYWFDAAYPHRGLLSDGLPYFLQDLWPQGFIGRTLSSRFPELELPARITDWSEQHVLTYLTLRGEDCTGNLLIGAESLQRYLKSSRGAQGWIDAGAPEKSYPKMAEAAISGAPVGSCAAGEHPKFTAVLQRGSQLRHVIVKFSPVVKDRSGERWSDLLVAEHLASKALGDVGVTAAATELVFCGKRVFLESTRFDRAGERGRIGVVSLAALVDHHLGQRDNWAGAASRLKALRVISAASAEAVRRAAAFGELIGNTDMHFGNLSFFFSFQGALSLAPVYDMLPMMYAPVGGEEPPKTHFEPPLPSAANLDIWPAIAERAERYWREVAEDERISRAFASLAAKNANAIARARKLLP